MPVVQKIWTAVLSAEHACGSRLSKPPFSNNYYEAINSYLTGADRVDWLFDFFNRSEMFLSEHLVFDLGA